MNGFQLGDRDGAGEGGGQKFCRAIGKRFPNGGHTVGMSRPAGRASTEETEERVIIMFLNRSRRTTLFGCLAVGLLAPLAVTGSAGTSNAATAITVAADGSGNYTTLQAGIAAASTGTVITVKPGTYQGQVSIPAAKSGLTIQGSTGVATDIVITGKVSQADSGSATGSATVLNLAKNTAITGVTIRNTYGSGSQALALYMGGDRQVYRNVRVLGRQDTLLSWGGTGSAQVRQYVYKSYIEGDVDFIYGNGALVIDSTTIKSLDRSSSNNGYITAAATNSSNPYGILITRSTLSSTAAAQTVALGRCWHAGGSTSAIGQVLIRDSSLGAHIRQTSAWQDMSGFSWKTCRFNEYNNSGSGRTNGTSDRPQMSASTAANYTSTKYLAGSDGWNPVVP
jgi:pectinesterase